MHPARPARRRTTTDDDYVRRGLAHLWVHTRQYNDLAEAGEFLLITSGDGSAHRRRRQPLHRRQVKPEGGQRRPVAGAADLAEVAARQMAELPFRQPHRLRHPPGGGPRLPPSGGDPVADHPLLPGQHRLLDVVDTALRMARQFHWNRGERRRFKVISRNGSYHGMTGGALSVNRSTYVNRAPFEPLRPGGVGVANVQCERCPFEKTYPSCDVFWRPERSSRRSWPRGPRRSPLNRRADLHRRGLLRATGALLAHDPGDLMTATASC